MKGFKVSVTCSLALWFLVLGNVSGISYYYMDDHCDGTIDISFIDEIRLKTTAFGNYRTDWTCEVTISASSLYRMMVYFKDINIENSGSCSADYLEMHDGSGRSSPDIGYNSKYCGYDVPSTVYTTTGDYLTLYFKSDWSITNTGFDIVITQYETGLCYSWEHECDNGRCIDESLVCNGYNPCGDHSDCGLNVAVVVGPVIGGSAFIVAIVVIVILVRRRRYARPVMPVYTGAPVATTVTSATATTSGTYGQPPGHYPQYGGYNAPVPQQYQQVGPLGNPPPYAPYGAREMGMPAAAK